MMKLKKILGAASKRDESGLRDRAIMELLYSSGLRVGELVSLKISDINIAEETIKVKGKGNKERIVPVGSYALNYIFDYLQKRRKFRSPYIFLNNKGGKITSRSVERIIKKYARIAGVSKKSHTTYFQTQFCHASSRQGRRFENSTGNARSQ